MDDQDLEALLVDLESDRVERKASLTDREKIRQAICAFANDQPDSQQPGVLFIGANDDGTRSDFAITDEALLSLASWRDNGQILPLPSMSVEQRVLRGERFIVVTVQPSDAPPVRYKGRVYIRVGPRRAIATAEEERRLAERRRARDDEYLPQAIATDALARNDRTPLERLASLRFTTPPPESTPTRLGLLVVGHDPQRFLPGAYLQFLRFDGTELSDPIKDQKDLSGRLLDKLRRLEDVLAAHISVATEIGTEPTEVRRPDYPLVALREIARNAILHRTYEGTNAPVRIHWFTDRIEIHSPGGPYGQVTSDNFGTPGMTDYRNPHLAEAMKNLGLVQKFGVGIGIARRALEQNGNPPLELLVEDSFVAAVLRRQP
jgi:ATP-dependent DNA helicase RecG